jgi:hypothetical protein
VANKKAKKRQKTGKVKATEQALISGIGAKPTAKKLEVLRVEPVPEFPNKHLVVLTIEDPPTPIPEIPPEMFPVVIEPAAIRDQQWPEVEEEHHPALHPPLEHKLWTWLKGIWG